MWKLATLQRLQRSEAHETWCSAHIFLSRQAYRVDEKDCFRLKFERAQGARITTLAFLTKGWQLWTRPACDAILYSFCHGLVREGSNISRITYPRAAELRTKYRKVLSLCFLVLGASVILSLSCPSVQSPQPALG